MRNSLLILVLIVSLAAFLAAQDMFCPSYATAVRTADQQAIVADMRFADSAPTGKTVAVPPARNFIDQWIFKKMSADGVEPAPTTTDTEFLRRIYIDLTGRIPTYEQTQAFLSDPNPAKRDGLVNSLLDSPAYVDQFAHWFLERFQVRGGNSWISLPASVNFYNYIREFVTLDRPYNLVVREMLSARGDSDIEPALPLLVRQVADFSNNPRQDIFDDSMDFAATEFLGLRTECISCHNGKGHLEKINLFLTGHTRRELWQLAAFFSRTRFQAVTDDNASFRPRLIVTDVAAGLYNSAIDPARPGARPSRASANEEPWYWFTDRRPEGTAWREELGSFLTQDRQFARAAVNYIWARLFGSGIVDPADGWDLNRVDPSLPLPEGWATQNSHPELLEALADYFIKNNYSLKSVVRLIVSSNTYQLSSKYPAGQWQDVYQRYFARFEARRLSAEQLVDSLATATGTDSQMSVPGLTGVLRYTNQLPYPYASSDGGIENLLNSLGRGDWVTRKSLSKPSLYGVLDFMNNWVAEVRTRATGNRYTPQTRVEQWLAEGLSDDAVVRRMFLATLTRQPSDDELRLSLDRKQIDRQTWFSGLQWALIQKSDFIFNY